MKYLGLLLAVGVLVGLAVLMLGSALYRWDVLWIKGPGLLA